MEEFWDHSSNGTKTFLCCGTAIVITITSIIMAAVATIEPTQQGILYNTFTKTLYDEQYKGGMHYAGITSRFIIYPANQVTIEFSNSKDSDQQPL